MDISSLVLNTNNAIKCKDVNTFIINYIKKLKELNKKKVFGRIPVFIFSPTGKFFNITEKIFYDRWKNISHYKSLKIENGIIVFAKNAVVSNENLFRGIENKKEGIINSNNIEMSSKLKLNKILRKEQEQIITEYAIARGYFMEKEYYKKLTFISTLNCPTGFGKTFLAIYIISVEKRKTLIISHLNDLCEQWLKEFLNMGIDDNKIKYLKREEDIDKELDVIICSPNFAFSNFHFFFNWASFLVLDEIHKFNLSNSTKASFLVYCLNPSRILFLSATIRGGNLETKINYGTVITASKNDYLQKYSIKKETVNLSKIKSISDYYRENTNKDVLSREIVININNNKVPILYSNLVDYIQNDYYYNEGFITYFKKTDYVNLAQLVIVYGRDHMDNIYNLLDQNFDIKKNIKIFKYDVLLSKKKKNEILEFAKINANYIIIATSKSFEVGINIHTLNCVHILNIFNETSTEQIIGRIFRDDIPNNKKYIYLYDSLSSCKDFILFNNKYNKKYMEYINGMKKIIKKI